MPTAQQTVELLAAARLLAQHAPELDDVTALDLERALSDLLRRIAEAHDTASGGGPDERGLAARALGSRADV